jgi:hypothetical protein
MVIGRVIGDQKIERFLIVLPNDDLALNRQLLEAMETFLLRAGWNFGKPF